MKKRMITIIVAIVILAAAIAGCIYYADDIDRQGLAIPDECRLIVAYSTGRDVKEESHIFYHDEEGNVLGSSRVGSVSSLSSIEYHEDVGRYNFFTHEKVFFSDGSILENKEMKDLYSFASEDGNDRVYMSGYFEPWDAFYKVIPHGLAYAHEDLGAFDILTIYDESRIDNVRMNETGCIGVDEYDGRIYSFLDELEKVAISYDIIEKKNGKYEKSTKELDVSGWPMDEDDAYSLHNAVIDEKYLYLMADRGEGSETEFYLLRYEKDGTDFHYIDALEIEPDSFGLAGNLEMRKDVVYIDHPDSIDYYLYYPLTDSPGRLTYDKEKNEFRYMPYNLVKEAAVDNCISIVREFGGDIYMLMDDGSEQVKIYHESSKGKFEKFMQFERSSDLFLGDFFVIE